MAQRKSQQPHSQERAWQPGPAPERGVQPGGWREEGQYGGAGGGGKERVLEQREGGPSNREGWEMAKEGAMASCAVIAAVLSRVKKM